MGSVTGVGNSHGAPGAGLRISLLGPLEVYAGTQRAQLGGPQPRAVLSLLALDPGITLPVSLLVEELWDHDPPRGATNTIQVYVSRLRRSLSLAAGTPGFAPLRAQPGGYRLDRPVQTDVQQFQALIAAGHEAHRRHDLESAVAQWSAALALWRGRGPALPDLRGPSGRSSRTGLEEQRMRTLADRLEAETALGQHATVVPQLQQLVHEHPLDERLVGLLMRALYRVGRQAEALESYRVAVRHLSDELGVDPGPQLRQLHSDLLHQEPALQPPRLARLPSTPPSPRPAAFAAIPRTALIGRRAELDQAERLLADPAVRLVTLAGPGGTGKTRLALELAARAGPGRPGRPGGPAPVVRLETATVAGDLLPRIAQAIRAVPAWPGQPLLEVITGALTSRLIVLDNLEGLVQAGGGPEVGRLLDAVPGLTVLCTSRTSLRLRGEHLLALPPLALPGAQHDHDPERVRASEAGQLFAERAAAALPGFTVDGGNCAAVAQVCRMLDGLPLAIELAAARVRLLTPEQMLARVGARLELLSGGAGDLPERQRSMRAVLESSVQLLDDAETALFARLSVFRGWDLASAEAVLGPVSASGSVLEGLHWLADRSLIVADGTGRFRMFGVVREYAETVLQERDLGAQALRRAHAEHFAARATQHSQDVGRHPDAATTGWPEQEAANLQAALEFAQRSQDGQLLAQLLSGLLDHWFYSGSIHQADRWIALADASTLGPRERAHLLLSAGNLALVAGDLDRAALMLTRAHTAARAAQSTPQDAELVARALAARSVVSRHRGAPGHALTLVDEALQAAATSGSWALTVRLGNERGELLDELGDTASAKPLFESFRDWSRAEDAPSNLAVAVVNLALVAAGRGDATHARDLLAQAVSAVTGGGSAPLRGDVLHAAGLAHLLLGDPRSASRSLREAAPLMFASGQLLTLPDTLALLAAAVLGTGHPVTAARLLGVSDAWRSGRQLAISGRRTRVLVASTRTRLAAELGGGEELQRELARGAHVPYGALPQIAAVTGWRRIWVADLRQAPAMGSFSANSMSSDGRSPAGSKPKTLP